LAGSLRSDANEVGLDMHLFNSIIEIIIEGFLPIQYSIFLMICM